MASSFRMDRSDRGWIPAFAGMTVWGLPLVSLGLNGYGEGRWAAAGKFQYDDLVAA